MSLVALLNLPPAPPEKSGMFGISTLTQVINLHKVLCGPIIFGMMSYYNHFSYATWLYLSIHTTYGLLWLVKFSYFSDKSFNYLLSFPVFVFAFLCSTFYWITPFLLISQDVSGRGDFEVTPPERAALAVAVYTWGIFLHYTSDCQKYYTLKYRKGLIAEGLFTRSRNMNYVGEVLIYSGFALLSGFKLPWAINLVYWLGLFLPSMLHKDKSLSRYPEFAKYKQSSGLFFPAFF